LLAKKLGEDPEKVTKHLWGDFYYHPKKKEFSTTPKN
jgi:hypothetical protein